MYFSVTPSGSAAADDELHETREKVIFVFDQKSNRKLEYSVDYNSLRI